MAGCHIQSGSKLLQEIVHDQQSDAPQYQTLGTKSLIDSYVPLEHLAAILAVLDRNAATVSAFLSVSEALVRLINLEQMLRDYRSEGYNKTLSGIMDSSSTNFEFSTIEEARNVFDHCLHSFTISNPAPLSSDTAVSTDLLQDHVDYCAILVTKFSSALRSWMNTRGPFLTPKEKISMAALQLHVLNSYVSFCVEHLPPAFRLHGDALLPQMKEMVSLCEEIISSISASKGFDDQRTSFCLDIGYIIPLYTVASQCQDMTTRRRAIALLRSAPRQEGLWNSRVVASAAERILEIEESSGEKLMPLAPVAALSTSPSPSTILQLDGRGVRLQYVKPGSDAAPIPVVVEVITW